jgi:hypothetical protein
LRSEALLKSALSGIAIGGAIAVGFATVAWFMEFSGAGIAWIVFAIASIVGGVTMYFVLFRPTIIQNARRLDRYGLEERLVTMVELEGQDSYIAQKQREDALKALSELDTKRVKYRISTVILVLALAAAILFSEMVFLEKLSEDGLIPTGKEVWLKIFPPAPLDQFSVEYIAEEGGYIEGDTDQSVTQGQDSQKVLAVAKDGYMFLRWSDGDADPSRVDKAVEKNITVKAVFIEVVDDGDDTEDSDEPDDAPGDNGQGEESLSNEGTSEDRYKEVNWVIDGQTYYRDEGVWDEYYEKMLDMLENGEAIPEEYRHLMELYFNVIK